MVLAGRHCDHPVSAAAPFAQLPAPCSGGAGAAPDAWRLRWARAMIRARMRSPVCILSRSLAVCCRDALPAFFLPPVPDFPAFPPDPDGSFFLVSFRISSRWWRVIGSPGPAGVTLSGSCRSPCRDFGRWRIRQRRQELCAAAAPEKTPRRGPHRRGPFQVPFFPAHSSHIWGCKWIGVLWWRLTTTAPV